MNATISDRSKKILQVLAKGQALSRVAIEQAINESRDNTIRELKKLVDDGLVATEGEARATVYSITPKARVIVVWDAKAYLAQDPDTRNARYKRLQSELFSPIKGSIGQPPAQIAKAAQNRRKIGDSVSARKDLYSANSGLQLRW